MLTALGVIIGIVAVTLMGTAINGISSGFDKSMAVLGDDVLYVSAVALDADERLVELPRPQKNPHRICGKNQPADSGDSELQSDPDRRADNRVCCVA